MVNPSLYAASRKRASKETKNISVVCLWDHCKAAANCNASAALRGWTASSRSAAPRKFLVGCTSGRKGDVLVF